MGGNSVTLDIQHGLPDYRPAFTCFQALQAIH